MNNAYQTVSRLLPLAHILIEQHLGTRHNQKKHANKYRKGDKAKVLERLKGDKAAIAQYKKKYEAKHGKGSGGGGSTSTTSNTKQAPKADTKASKDTKTTEKPKTYKSVDEANKEFHNDKDWQQWKDGLSKAEQTAITSYTSEMGYQSLNKNLRENKNLSKKDQKIADGLDSALSKSELKQDTQLYRGFFSDDIFKQIESGQLKKGGTLTDPAFVSTSVTKQGGFSGNVQMNIKAPAGTKGGYMTHKDLNGWPNETEWLLPRGTNFKITNTKIKAGKAIVDVEII